MSENMCVDSFTIPETSNGSHMDIASIDMENFNSPIQQTSLWQLMIIFGVVVTYTRKYGFH